MNTNIRSLLTLALCGAFLALPASAVDLEDIRHRVGGYALAGLQIGDFYEVAAGVGDVNGDGIDDIVSAAHGEWNSSLNGNGVVYVIYGRRSHPVQSLESIKNGEGGFIITASSGDFEVGHSIQGTGDVNGDGLDDFVIRSSRDAFVVFGREQSKALQTSDLRNGSRGFVITFGDLDDALTGVSGAGDVNGDGLPDVLVSAMYASRGSLEECGEAYVVFGRTSTEPVDLTDVGAGIGGFAMTGFASGMRVGTSLNDAGDVNGDGLDDVILGSPYAVVNDNVLAGQAFVVFGKSDSEHVDLADIVTGNGGFVVNGTDFRDGVAASVFGVGDQNGDGLRDVMVSWGGHDSGYAYAVIFGKSSTSPVDLLDIANGAGGYVIQTENVPTRVDALRFAEAANDINGDGIMDFMFQILPTIVVAFGNGTGAPINLSDAMNNVNGFTIVGLHSSTFGSGAGDINGDGITDIVLGTAENELGGPTNSGTVYFVYSPYGSVRSNGGDGGSSGGCLIATAAYGSPLASQLNPLRGLRDRALLPSALGAAFTDAYYRISPPVARAIAEHDRLRTATRALLAPLVGLSKWLESVATTNPSKQ